MSRKAKEKRGAAPLPDGPLDGLSMRGKKVMSVGVALVALGFIALSRVDPMGRNWAAVLSPFLILGGYAAIGTGIFLPEPSPSSPEIPSSPEKTS